MKEDLRGKTTLLEERRRRKKKPLLEKIESVENERQTLMSTNAHEKFSSKGGERHSPGREGGGGMWDGKGENHGGGKRKGRGFGGQK